MEKSIKKLKELKQAALFGGGKAKIEALHQKGKLSARERLDLLLDPGSFSELHMLLGHAEGRAGEGVITGHGTVEGRPVAVFSQDTTVRGGAMGLMQGIKYYRITEMALNMGVPLVGLNDSPGARAYRPDEPEELYHEKGAGAVFFANTQASGVIPQISAIMGTSAGIAVYSPALTDFIFMVDGISNMFITGPRIVKSVMGEDISAEELGGARVHARVSGVCDFRLPSEEKCIENIKKLLSYLPANCREAPPVLDTGDDPERMDDTLADLVPGNSRKSYDIRRVIKRLVDSEDFLEVKKEFAPEMVVGFGRMEGHTVGFVANQPMALAGALTSNSSRKQARFMRFCDAFNIPIILLLDTPAYAPGSSQEHGGIIHHGAKVLYALCESTVPRVAVILRKMYGGGNLGMGVHPGLGTDFTFAWPLAEIGTLGAKETVQLFHGEELRKAENPDELREQLIAFYQDRYGNPFTGASVGRFNIEDVIEPRETRSRIIRALRVLRDKHVTRYPKKHGNIPM
ncbi:acyl-CoA carboxylase subunit beta [Chloroflexota bacterium]